MCPWWSFWMWCSQPLFPHKTYTLYSTKLHSMAIFRNAHKHYSRIDCTFAIQILELLVKIACREEKVGHNSYLTYHPRNPHCVITNKDHFQERTVEGRFGGRKPTHLHVKWLWNYSYSGAEGIFLLLLSATFGFSFFHLERLSFIWAGWALSSQTGQKLCDLNRNGINRPREFLIYRWYLKTKEISRFKGLNFEQNSRPC